ncbi:uncharacterized protein N7500_004636 [Penicillium coprophilum]|uniref:uncharacterized protein n=1 Tax=Penicillium coprophilum TaxID=36646 RepID=UPI0023941C63|nr:uncharacterized protein N7500_004636 [Penicillium coprophilum]KAJ5162806.1 hypothetical protein N7500_004636 [Penicillium coprophilum]
MAPAIRAVTQTLIEDTTFVKVVTLENIKPWPTLNLVTYTVTKPHTTVIRVIDTGPTPTPESHHPIKSRELSDGKKGAIAGSVLGVVVFLLLLYYLYVCRLQWGTSITRPAKLPPDSKDPEASDPTPPDPAPIRQADHYTSCEDNNGNERADRASDKGGKIGKTSSLFDSRTGETAEGEEASET